MSRERAPGPVTSRRTFIDLYEGALQHAYGFLLETGELKYEQNLPKTYLVEFHPLGGVEPSQNGLEERLGELLDVHDLNVVRVEDDMFVLAGPRASFVVDAGNPRFTLFHTLTNSVVADDVILRKLVPTSPTLDLAWLTPTFLKRYGATVTVEGWAARFRPLVERSRLRDLDFVPRQERVEIESGDAWERYLRFERSNEFDHLPLEVLRVRTSDQARVARARFSSVGKATARGNSFLLYQEMVLSVRDSYANEIGTLEERFRIGFPTHDERVVSRGEPYWIRFRQPLESFQELIEHMFSGAEPFRLLGFPERVKDDLYRIHAVDLHVATRLYVEATPNWIRVYMPRQGCGNTLTRLVRALQLRVSDALELAEIA